MLAQRRFTALRPIAALGKRGSGEVDEDLRAIPFDVRDDSHIGITRGNVGPLTVALTKLIDDGILDLLRDEARMRERAVLHGRVDGESTILIEPTRPVDSPRAFVQRFGITRLKLGLSPEDPESDATAQAGTHRVREPASEVNPAPISADLRQAQFAKLVTQRTFRPAGRRRKKGALFVGAHDTPALLGFLQEQATRPDRGCELEDKGEARVRAHPPVEPQPNHSGRTDSAG